MSTGTPICLRTSASALRPASIPGPRKLDARGAVGLVEGGLEDERNAERLRHVAQPAGDLQDQRLALDHAGSCNQEERPVRTDLEGGQLHAVARPGCSAARYLRAARMKPVNKG